MRKEKYEMKVGRKVGMGTGAVTGGVIGSHIGIAFWGGAITGTIPLALLGLYFGYRLVRNIESVIDAAE